MIAAIAHDAGGAEILSSLARRQKLECKYALSGPALPIFQKKIEGITNQTTCAAVEGAELLICGTSSPSTFELDAISLARSGGIKSIAILDHWMNFRERFLRSNQLIIPDEVWVVDEVAEKIALKALPEANIRRIENPYKEDFLEKMATMRMEPFNQLKLDNCQTVLYVTEPTSEHAARKYGDARYWGYTEVEAIKYFFERIKIISPLASKIIIRPHPSENPSKYDFAHENPCLEVRVSRERELVTEIAEADIIAGCNSMAMVAARWAKKRVICCIPPGGQGFSLPRSGIEFVNEMRI
jgi:hypothetical protein